jgi:hypothetical protein
MATASVVCNHSICSSVWWGTGGLNLQEEGPSVQRHFNFCSKESITSPNLIVGLSQHGIPNVSCYKQSFSRKLIKLVLSFHGETQELKTIQQKKQYCGVMQTD